MKLPNCIGSSVMHQPFSTTAEVLKKVRELTPEDQICAV